MSDNKRVFRSNKSVNLFDDEVVVVVRLTKLVGPMRRLSLHVLLESIPDAIVDRYMSQVCSNWVLLKRLVEVLLVKPLGRVQPYLQVLT